MNKKQIMRLENLAAKLLGEFDLPEEQLATISFDEGTDCVSSILTWIRKPLLLNVRVIVGQPSDGSEPLGWLEFMFDGRVNLRMHYRYDRDKRVWIET